MIFLVFQQFHSCLPFRCRSLVAPFLEYDKFDISTSRHPRFHDLAVLGPRPLEITKSSSKSHGGGGGPCNVDCGGGGGGGVAAVVVEV